MSSGANKRIDIKQDAEHGRYYVAATQLDFGEELFTEEPLAAVINDDHVSNYCHCCFRTSSSLSRCKACKSTYYCSAACQVCHVILLAHIC